MEMPLKYLLECTMKERCRKNINKSIELLQIAADQGDQEAAKNIEIIKRECGC